MSKTSFNEKVEIVKSGVEHQLEVEGVNLEGLEETIGKITESYMLVVQCLWYRLTNDKKVANLINKFEEEAQLGMSLLETHKFEDLVYTFRSIKTNLYQVSSGVGRKYNLSTKDYREFLENIENGTYEVIGKPIKVKVQKKSKKATKVAPVKTSFLVSMATKGVVSLKTPKVVVQKKAKKVVSKKQPKGWVEDSSVLTKGRFTKVKLQDSSNIFGRFEKIATIENEVVYYFRKNNNDLVEVPSTKIAKIFTYSK